LLLRDVDVQEQPLDDVARACVVCAWRYRYPSQQSVARKSHAYGYQALSLVKRRRCVRRHGLQGYQNLTVKVAVPNRMVECILRSFHQRFLAIGLGTTRRKYFYACVLRLSSRASNPDGETAAKRTLDAVLTCSPT